MKKIFCIEDDEKILNMWKLSFQKEIMQGKITIISAMTIKEAEEKFLSNHDIDIIVIDGCVPGRELNTIPLVKKIKKSFKGIMIGTSSVDEYRRQLLGAGCDFECTKWNLPITLSQLIK